MHDAITIAAWVLILGLVWWFVYRRLIRRLAPLLAYKPLRPYVVVKMVGIGSPALYLVPAVFWILVDSLADRFGTPWLKDVAVLILLPILLDYLLLRPRRLKSFRAEVAAREYRICPTCLYRLEGLPEEGNCPECGRRFASPALRQEWQVLLDLPHKQHKP